jgi:hypothetical protein
MFSRPALSYSLEMRHFFFAVIVCGLLCAPNLFGQQSKPAPSSSEGWQFRDVPYLWGTDLKGRAGIRDRSVDVDASFGNILDNLHMAFMNFTEAAWNNQFVFLNDLVYSDLREYRATPGPLFSGVTPSQKLFFITPEGGYRFLNSGRSSADIVGGIRYWHLKSELDFQPGLLSGINLQGSRGWTDGILGLQGKTDLSDNWSLSGYGDVGGGGANIDYQFVGTAAVNFHEHYGVTFGYRYLKVNYNKDDFLFDNKMKGPLIGFIFKF